MKSSTAASRLLAAAGLALPVVLAAVPSTASASQKVSAVNVQSVTDPSGNVFDVQGASVSNPNADVHVATASDDNGTIKLSLSTYGNPNPSTDSGWQTNNSSFAYTYAAWELVTSSGQEYTAYFDTNANVGDVPGTLHGELHSVSGSKSSVLSCAVTPSFDSTNGYQVSFSAACLGSPGSFNWYSYLIYHPAGTASDYFLGKAAPEESTYPTTAQFAGSVAYAPVVTQSGAALASPGGRGYWLVAKDGGVFSYGDAAFDGSTGNIKLNQPIVGAAATSDTNGYWMVASDGGVFTYGDAKFYGSAGSLHLNKPVVGMAPSVAGGYWLVATDGGVFSYGNAAFYGSTGGTKLNQPIVGVASTPDGKGYWLVASDGGVFSYGDAAFYGSTGGTKLNQPIVGVASTPDGKGYWLVASDGGVFSYGDAAFYGSTGNIKLNQPIVALAPSL